MEEIIKNNPILTSVITSILSAFLGFYFLQKGKKTEQFQNQVSENIKEVCSPIFNSLRKIKQANDTNIAMTLLEEFFDKYTSPETNIHKIGNAFIVRKFYELEQTFRDYINNPENEMILEDLRKRINNFYPMVETEYWNNLHVIYGKYKWNRFVNQINIFIRIWYYIVHLLYEISVFSVIACSWAVCFGIMDIILPQKLFPKSYLHDFILIWLASFIIFGFAMMLSASYLEMTHNEYNFNNKIKFLLLNKLSSLVKNIIRTFIPKTLLKYTTKKKKISSNHQLEQHIKIPKLTKLENDSY